MTIAPVAGDGERLFRPADGWTRGTRRVVAVVPLAGAGVVAITASSDPVYRVLVREDGVLEWLQAIVYGATALLAIVATPRLWGSGARFEALVVAALGLLSFVSLGEELSWGQRLLAFETPDIASGNSQGELTLHNDERFEDPARVGLLLAGLYGAVAPFVARRPAPVVPPRVLVPWFAVVAGYFAFRLVWLEAPSYAEAKYSEWPETCLAVAVGLWTASVVAGGGRPLERGRDAPL